MVSAITLHHHFHQEDVVQFLLNLELFDHVYRISPRCSPSRKSLDLWTLWTTDISQPSSTCSEVNQAIEPGPLGSPGAAEALDMAALWSSSCELGWPLHRERAEVSFFDGWLSGKWGSLFLMEDLKVLNKKIVKSSDDLEESFAKPPNRETSELDK